MPTRHDTTLSNQGNETLYVLGNCLHKAFGKFLIRETFIHIFQKPPTEQWMIEKLMASAGLDFQWIFSHFDTFLGHQISATSPHPPSMVFQQCNLPNIPVLQSTLLPAFPDRPAATTNRMSQATET